MEVAVTPTPSWLSVIAVVGGDPCFSSYYGEKLGRSVLQGLERVIQLCIQLARRGLHPEELVDQEKNSLDALKTETQDGIGSQVFMILTRLLALFLSLDVLLSLYILDASRVPLVVFGGASEGAVHIPLSIPTVLGLLSWALATLQGAFLLEIIGVIPTSAEFCRRGGVDSYSEDFLSGSRWNQQCAPAVLHCPTGASGFFKAPADLLAGRFGDCL